MEALPRSALLALCELGNGGTMRAAADLLGVTPGAISQQISGLEGRLGIALIEPMGRGVRLTDAGEVLLAHAGRILDAQDSALAALEAARTSVAGVVTIGLFGSTAALVPGVVATVAERHPGITVRVREVDVDDALASVRRGVVDLAFGLDYPDAPITRDDVIELSPLLVESFAIACSPAAPPETEITGLARWRDVSWILPPETTHYGRAMRAACRRAGFEPIVAHVVTDTAASLALAAAGQGITPVTAMMASLAPADSVRIVGLREPVLRELCLAEPRRSERRSSALAVAAVIREAMGIDA